MQFKWREKMLNKQTSEEKKNKKNLFNPHIYETNFGIQFLK